MNILVVDDDQDILSFIHTFLQDRYHLVTVSDPQKALDLFQSSPEFFQIVIVDVFLWSEMGGIELATALRNLNQHVKLLFITNYKLSQSDAFAQKINELGHALEKPFYPQQLLDMIADL